MRVRPTTTVRIARTVASLVVLCAATSCTADDANPEPAESIGPATTAAPEPGTRRVTCDVTAEQGPVTLALDIPESYATSRNDPCRWRIPVADQPEPRGGRGPIADTIVTVYATDDQNLQPTYDELAPRAEIDGDDSISDLELRTDVPVFNDTVGDRLSYLSAADGVGVSIRTALAGGVVLQWSFPPDDGETDAAIEAALASAGVVDEPG